METHIRMSHHVHLEVCSRICILYKWWCSCILYRLIYSHAACLFQAQNLPSVSNMSEIEACHSISYCWWSFSSAISHLLSFLQSVTLLASSLSASPCMQLLYGFSSGHVGMWESDHKESWALKNWCFWTVVLEKTLESPLDCKEITPVHPKGNQPWIFIGRTDAEAETPILWPPDAKNWLIGKDPDAGKDWRQEEKGMTEDEMVGWHHRLNGHEFE